MSGVAFVIVFKLRVFVLKATAQYVKELDDRYLLRFLRARNLDVKAAVKQVTEAKRDKQRVGVRARVRLGVRVRVRVRAGSGLGLGLGLWLGLHLGPYVIAQEPFPSLLVG